MPYCFWRRLTQMPLFCLRPLKRRFIIFLSLHHQNKSYKRFLFFSFAPPLGHPKLRLRVSSTRSCKGKGIFIHAMKAYRGLELQICWLQPESQCLGCHPQGISQYPLNMRLHLSWNLKITVGPQSCVRSVQYTTCFLRLFQQYPVNYA